MSDRIEFGSGDNKVRIEGLGKTVRALQKAGADAEDMRDLMHALGSIVVDAASPPVVSGKLAGTIRAGRGKTKAVVRAGGAKAKYAGVAHYGWPAKNKPANPFLTSALQANQGRIFSALDAGLADILKKNDLT
ncbi:hypothetical protein [Microbacterium paludicola]|uniref:hypothetical protein n=1 Tax=Microbacterium paludicola TaxID=300019 RepID=UPI000903708E|nr:hypothetical protein [Microbacterium paludicola]APF33385.1 hypothetical protein BO218_03535 [Microbacterium paludicola]